MSWTSPQNIKDRWLSNKVVPTDQKLQTFIEDVELDILSAFPKIQERIDANELSLALITKSVSNWIIEFLLTEGTPFSQESQSYAGAASRSVTYNTNARYTLELSAADLSIFLPLKKGKAMSISLLSADVRIRNVWNGSGWSYGYNADNCFWE